MRRPKPRPRHGLYARNYPHAVRWKLDYPQEWLEALPDEAAQWLSTFLDEYVGAKIRREAPLHASTALKREVYKARAEAGRDVYAVPTRPEAVDINQPGEERDWRPARGYLSSPEYLEALAEYRACLPANYTHNPRQDARYKAALARLNAARKGHP